MIDEVVIRPALADDVDLVARLRLRFLAEHRGVGPDSFGTDFVAATRDFLGAGLSAGTVRAWVAEAGGGKGDDGKAVGAVSVVISHLPPKPDDLRTGQAHVLNLWVDPLNRRRGLGRALLGTVERWAAELGFRLLVLHTTEDGRTLYAEAGFGANEHWREPRAAASLGSVIPAGDQPGPEKMGSSSRLEARSQTASRWMQASISRSRPAGSQAFKKSPWAE